MSYRAIEEDIVEHLRTVLKPRGVEVVAMPDSNADKQERKPCRITVGYAGSEFDRKESNVVAQIEDITLTVVIEANRLSDKTGVYALLAATKLRLIGYRPKNCQRIRIKSIEATSYEQGQWMYLMTISTHSMITIPENEEEALAPLLAQIQLDTVNYQFEEFTDEVFPE